MGWFGRKRRDDGGYQDNAALSGFGGYQPSDAPKFPSAGYGKTDPAPGPAEPAQQPSEPDPPRQSRTPAQPPRGTPRKVNLRLVKAVPIVILIGVFGYNVFSAKSHRSASTDDTPRAPYTYQPEPRVVVPPVVPGWQSVAGKDGSYAYDVPPSWEPAPTTLHGWDAAAGSPGINLSTSAFLGQHTCKEDPVGQIGGAGFTTEKTGDAAEAARKAVTDLGISAYTGEGAPPAKVTPGAPEKTEVKNDSRAGTLVIAEVTPSNAPCQPKSVLVGALALGAGEKSAVLVAYSEQGRPGSASRDDLVRILHSYRAVPAADRSTTTPPPTTR
ncbi:hypothetical protein CU254_08460 [Amycolatopsis sp. AA4]|uniref:hypothetical protein n=1 Tax=Actinomycetes TaxID=1760 RepID=UPI0001DEE3F9|nr:MULTISPECIES: hypothetical protein [Actinomycetes]ATY10492.1 hypothetical protein CU254_08460 [Amycolatopsis sp. AA4]EFL05980.1 predicted protein [Streptomyces sp. AA4]